MNEQLLQVAKKIIEEIDYADYGEGELRNGSLRMLVDAVKEVEPDFEVTPEAESMLKIFDTVQRA